MGVHHVTHREAGSRSNTQLQLPDATFIFYADANIVFYLLYRVVAIEFAEAMKIRAEPDKSLTRLIFIAAFLTWACHLGTPQLDQLGLPVCGRHTVNSSSDHVKPECKLYKLSNST